MKLAVMTAAAAVLMATGPAQAAPLEAYGKLPTMNNVTISPDGTKVAFVQQVAGKYTVVIDSLNPAAVIVQVPPTVQKIRDLVWADPSHLLVLRSQASDVLQGGDFYRGDWVMVQSLDLTTRKASQLFTHPKNGSVLSSVTAVPQVRMVGTHPVVFGLGTRAGLGVGGNVLMTADLASGVEDVVDTIGAVQGSRDWLIDDQGVPAVRETYDQYEHIFTLQLKHGGQWMTVYSLHTLIDPPHVLGVTPDGGSVVLETQAPDGSAERRLVSLADGKVSGPQPQFAGFSDWLNARQNGRIVGAVKNELETSYVFFDPKLQAGWDSVMKAFPDELVDPVSWSDDMSKVVVLVTGARHGMAYEIVDLATHKATDIGQGSEGIKGDDVADVQVVAYKAKDGLSIQGFLTLPTGREAKNLPLIVMPHGGPAARDQSGFDWLAQALASRGYAVLQPEFRGSAGLSYDLQKAAYGEFGRKMQSDLSDGVRALGAAGFIDPKRVCIVGASYGGYAALAGVTLEQGVYRCAVSIAGISDVRKMAGNGLTLANRSTTVRYLDRYVGAKDPTDRVYDDISPVKHAADASAPILLIHGKEDFTVPLEQSQAMEAALKRANKPVESITLEKGDHSLLIEDMRLQALQATVAFVEKNNPAH